MNKIFISILVFSFSVVFTKDFTPTVKTDSGLISSNNTRMLNNDINGENKLHSNYQ